MLTRVHDTIAAIASATGPGWRGIVRLSGEQSLACAERCFRANDGGALQRGQTLALQGSLKLSDVHSPIPCTALIWPGARSYTRQPSVEFHLPGSAPLLSAVLQELCRSGARLAEPGEFTLRAFLAGRIDLTQVDGVLGVIDAENQRELAIALEQLAGGVTQPFHQLREELLEVLAQLEAGLDFVEEDIEFITAAEVARRVETVLRQVEGLRARFANRHESSQLPRVVITGCPNVGKSSLFNALCGGRHALVADEAGTTRDYLRHLAVFDGVACQLLDTAGLHEQELRDSSSLIEIDQMARRTALRESERADLRLFCIDSTRDLNEWESAQLRDNGADAIVVRTKCDLVQTLPSDTAIAVSAHTGFGLDVLRNEIRNRLTTGRSSELPVVAVTADRCQEALVNCQSSLENALRSVTTQAGDELVALDLRASLDSLGKIVGTVATDDLLDRIFTRFCIGK